MLLWHLLFSSILHLNKKNSVIKHNWWVMLRLKSWNQQSSSFVLYSAYSDHFYPLQSPDTAQTLRLIPGVCKGYNVTFFISKLVFNIIASSFLFSHNLNRSQQGGGQYSSTPPPSSYNQGGYRPSHSGGHQSFQRKTHTHKQTHTGVMQGLIFALLGV